MQDVAQLIQAITGLLWPLITAVLLWRLLPALRKVIESRDFSVKVGGVELSVQELADKLVKSTAELQAKASAAAPAPDEPQPSATPMPEHRTLRRILWVDDDPQHNAYETAQLEALGASVTTVRSTREAMAALDQPNSAYDAVITDSDLSGVDLTGAQVLGTVSVGKHLFTRFADGRSLHSHFRMDGAWHLYRPGQPWRRPAHEARAVLATADRVAVGFALHDLELVLTAQEGRLVAHLGPDLLDPAWSAAHAAEAPRRFTARGSSEVGLVLTEQRVMAGIGNLYKCETCFLTGVTPWTLARDVPDPAAVIALARELLRRNAGRPQQSTTGLLGRDEQHWVFERAGRPCRRCGTRIRIAPQGEGVYTRPVYWCPRCQVGPQPD